MKRLHYTGIFLFVLGLYSTAAFAQRPTVTTAVDRNKILIGEQIGMRVQVTMPDNRYQLTWFTVPSDFGAFVLASKGKIDSTYTTGTLDFQQELRVTSFDSGSHVIPPLALHFTSLTGDSSFQMFTDSIPVEVMYSPADTVLPFHDIKPIIAVKTVQQKWFWPALIAAIIILLLILWFVLRKRRKTESNPFESLLSDYEEAMKSLQALQADHLPAKGAYKQYYSRLTDIFKRYISRKTGQNKMHLTGADTIRELTAYNIPKSLHERFADCIRLADAVKFARFTPDAAQSEGCAGVIAEVIGLLHKEKKEDEDAV